MAFNNNSIARDIQGWFILIDILMIKYVIFAIILATFFLIVIHFDKTCHTVPMILFVNSYLSGFVCGCVLFSMILFTL